MPTLRWITAIATILGAWAGIDLMLLFGDFTENNLILSLGGAAVIGSSGGFVIGLTFWRVCYLGKS